jgi:hypothetical protein
VAIVQVELNGVAALIHPHWRDIVAADHPAAQVAKLHPFDAHDVDLRTPYILFNPDSLTKFPFVERSIRPEGLAKHPSQA